MKTTTHDELETAEGFRRYAVPALAWVALFATLAIAGVLMRDEPEHMADAAPAVVRLTAGETAGAPFRAPDAPSERESAIRDEAITVHRALDPVGAGLDAAR